MQLHPGFWLSVYLATGCLFTWLQLPDCGSARQRRSTVPATACLYTWILLPDSGSARQRRSTVPATACLYTWLDSGSTGQLLGSGFRPSPEIIKVYSDITYCKVTHCAWARKKFNYSACVRTKINFWACARWKINYYACAWRKSITAHAHEENQLLRMHIKKINYCACAAPTYQSCKYECT